MVEWTFFYEVCISVGNVRQWTIVYRNIDIWILLHNDVARVTQQCSAVQCKYRAWQLRQRLPMQTYQASKEVAHLCEIRRNPCYVRRSVMGTLGIVGRRRLFALNNFTAIIKYILTEIQNKIKTLRSALQIFNKHFNINTTEIQTKVFRQNKDFN